MPNFDKHELSRLLDRLLTDACVLDQCTERTEEEGDWAAATAMRRGLGFLRMSIDELREAHRRLH